MHSDDFNRYDFLLQLETCYFQPSPKSDEALDWVCAQDASCWTADNHDLFQLVLQQLEQWQVNIDRSDISEATLITAEPQSQVMVS